MEEKIKTETITKFIFHRALITLKTDLLIETMVNT